MNKNDLICDVYAHNEANLDLGPSIDKEQLVLEEDDFLISEIVAWIGYIDLAFEDMVSLISDRPNKHLRTVLSHPIHIGIETKYS